MVGSATAPEFDSGPHVFNKTGGEKIIKAKNDQHWSFQGITINSIYTHPDGSSTGCDYKPVETKYPVKTYYKTNDRNHSLISDWFSIEQLDKRHIRIKMDENKTGEDIYIKVHIFAGDAVEAPIVIEQKAE